MLGMYQAELASILGLQCADIGRMAAVQQFLIQPSATWDNAILFMRLYQCLYKRYNGEEALMVHWLRAEQTELNNSPLLLMVDHGQLESILNLLLQMDT